MLCEEGKGGALKATVKSRCLTLPALFLLRNKLPKVGGRRNRDLKLTTCTGAAGEAADKGRHSASSACWPSWGCVSFPSAPCSVLTEGLGRCSRAWGWCVIPLSSRHPLCLPFSWQAESTGKEGASCGGATPSSVSRAQSGATVMPDSFCHHFSLSLRGTRFICCLGGLAACSSGISEGSGCSQGSLRSCVATGLTLSFGYHNHVLFSPPSPTRSLSAVIQDPLPREKTFTPSLPRTCNQT